MAWNTPFERYRNRRRRKAIRLEALRSYGGEHPRCSCECGCLEDCWLMLDLDHPNNDGAEHRRLITEYAKSNTTLTAKHAKGMWDFYTALKKIGWPNNPPIRVLCVYCNVGRQRNSGRCPRLGVLPDHLRMPATHRRGQSSQFSAKEQTIDDTHDTDWSWMEG